MGALAGDDLAWATGLREFAAEDARNLPVLDQRIEQAAERGDKTLWVLWYHYGRQQLDSLQDAAAVACSRIPSACRLLSTG